MEKLSYREKEMRRLCGAIPEQTIKNLKQEMTNFLVSCPGWIAEMKAKKLDSFQPENYRDHNYMDISGSALKTMSDGFYGTELIIDDLHHVELPKEAPVTDLFPPVMLNDLVVKTTTKTQHGKERRYDVHRFDPENGMMYFSRYETLAGHYEDVPIKPCALLRDQTIQKETVWRNGETVMVYAATIPIQWVISMLIIGMNSQWEDMSYADYPLFVVTMEGGHYELYRDYSRTDKSGDHRMLEEILDESFGFQRYLIRLTQNRGKVEVHRERSRGGQNRRQNPETSVERKRSAIILDEAYTVYTEDINIVKGIRRINKCGYRYSVRGHMRHYKNGKTIWIRPFEKNKDKPFRSHQYGQQ